MKRKTILFVALGLLIVSAVGIIVFTQLRKNTVAEKDETSKENTVENSTEEQDCNLVWNRFSETEDFEKLDVRRETDENLPIYANSSKLYLTYETCEILVVDLAEYYGDSLEADYNLDDLDPVLPDLIIEAGNYYPGIYYAVNKSIYEAYVDGEGKLHTKLIVDLREAISDLRDIDDYTWVLAISDIEVRETNQPDALLSIVIGSPGMGCCESQSIDYSQCLKSGGDCASFEQELNECEVSCYELVSRIEAISGEYLISEDGKVYKVTKTFEQVN